ncbi:MCE family protein [Pseudonocardia spinosispora]|uniref:MCE family protein n=1 Tax=Pseudonocardia spinosispora TaxID=103441 RepID=UPI000417F74C|nr:MCE family protein [Pseudonocardia spinosispora]
MKPYVLIAVAALACAVALVAWLSGPSEKHLTADFANSTNLYPGAPVKVLGVQIGTVDSVTVTGARVLVRMSYQGGYSLPEQVHAAVVPPSIVGDRFVQLTPPYTGGPALPDQARLDARHTQVPVELDQTVRSLDDLATALGPRGANSGGAVSRLVTEAAGNLKGNGAAIDDTVHQLSGALDTLASGRADIAGTVTNLGELTGTLAGSDGQVRDLVDNLAAVSNELDGQRDELRGAGGNLDRALRDIAEFVRENRDGVTGNITELARVTGTLARHQRDLAEVLDVTPLGVSNLNDLMAPLNFDPRRGGPPVDMAGRTTAIPARPDPVPQTLPTQFGSALTSVCTQLPAEQQALLRPTCTALQRSGGDFAALLQRAADPVLGPGLTGGTR